jgi:hypothetical protein
MFLWLDEIEKPLFPFNSEAGDLKIERLTSSTKINKMSSFCQIFASLDVLLNEDGLLQVPTPNKIAISAIMNEVVPHYLDVKQIFFNGKLQQLNVRGLKEESKKIVEDLLTNGIYPVIPDLYRTKGSSFRTGPTKVKYYSINQGLIDPLYIKETEKVRDFICCSFFIQNGFISIQPTGWYLEDELKNSITLRTFTTFAKQMVLVVNSVDNSVIGLDIYGE